MAYGVQLQGLETCIDSRGKQPLLHAFDATSLLQVGLGGWCVLFGGAAGAWLTWARALCMVLGGM
jgi:hypothetical protein